MPEVTAGVAAAPLSAEAPPGAPAARAPQRTMLRSFVTIGVLQLVTMLVLLVRTKSLALLLGPAAVGVIAVADRLFAVLVQTISLSLPFAALRFLPERWHRGPTEFDALFVRMRNVLLLLAAALTAGAIAVTLWRPATWGAELLPYRDVVLAGALAIPTLALWPLVQNALAGRMEQNRSMTFGLAHAVVLTVATVAGVLWHGVVGFYLLYAVLGAVLVAAGLRMVRPRPTHEAPDAPATGRDATSASPVALPPAMWRFSGTLLVLTFVMPFVALQVNYAVLGRHGAEGAGLMQAAIGISLAVRSLLGSSHAVFLTPNVNRGGTPAERMQWATHFLRNFCFVAALSVPAVLLMPHLAVELLYSRAFVGGAAFVALFVIAEVVNLVAGTYQALVIAYDHMRFHLIQNVLAQLAMLGVALVLIPRWGIAGVGAAMLVAPVVQLSSTLVLLARVHGVRVDRRATGLLAYALAGLTLAGVAGIALPPHTWQALALKAVLYAAIVGGLVALLSTEERAVLAHLAARVRPRARAA